MPWPEDTRNRETLWNLLTYGTPEPRYINYADKDLVDLGPDWPKVPKPLAFQPEIPVTGGQDLAKLVRQFSNFAPELKRHIGDLRYGPNADVVQELAGSNFLPQDYSGTNLMGLTSRTINKKNMDWLDPDFGVKKIPARISLNPRLAYENDPDYTLEGVLGHELTHSAGGRSEQSAEMSRSLLAGKSPIQSSQADRPEGQSMPQYADTYGDIPEWTPDTTDEIPEWTPDSQQDFGSVNLIDAERNKIVDTEKARQAYIQKQRHELGYGREDDFIFDTRPIAEAINRGTNQWSNLVGKQDWLPDNYKRAAGAWGSMAGSGMDLIANILADPTTAATTPLISRSMLGDFRPRPEPVPMIPRGSAGNAYAAPAQLMRIEQPPRSMGNLNPIPSNNWVVGEGGTVPNMKIGSMEPGLLAREGAEILTPHELDLPSTTPIGRDATDLSRALDTEHAAEQARIAGLKYTDAEQYPGTRFPVNVADNVPPRFQSGDTGLGFNPQSDAGAIRQGDVTNMETGEITSAGNISASPPLPYPLNIVPNSLRPRAAQEAIGRLRPVGQDIRSMGIELPQPTTSNIPPLMRDIPSEIPPTPANPRPTSMPAILAQDVDEFGRRVENAQVPPARSTQPPPPPITPDVPLSAENISKIPTPTPANPLPSVPKPNERILPTMTPKQALRTWSQGINAAKVYGMKAMREFQDLVDPKLIDSYQKGNRQGRLADVQSFLDNLFAREKEAGLFRDAGYRDDYLRQYWDLDKSDPEAVRAVQRKLISDNPGFTKDRTFETYEAGKAAGLVPKYNTIAEIISARTAESAKAIYTRELYNYLKGNGWLKSKINSKGKEVFGTISNPGAWVFQGPHANELGRLTENYLTKSAAPISLAADAANFAKNIYLSGGIPGTKYNIHAFNVARADAKLMGYGKAAGELFTDPTGQAAAKWWAELTPDQVGNLAELVEHGYVFHPLEGIGGSVKGTAEAHPFINRLPDTGKLGKLKRVGVKTTETVQDWFESPLFDRALPTLKLQRAFQVLEKLEKEMPRSEALDRAAQIANEYYGGIDKSLRNKNVNDISKFVLIAPDWAEAKVRQAIHEYKSTAKTLTGTGNAADKMKAKAFGRGLGITAAGGVGSELYYGNQGSNQSEFAGIPLPGSELILPEGAYLPTMGTFDESTRPLTIMNEMAKGYTGQGLVTEIGNRINPILRSGFNLGTNRNVFGGQLWGPNVPAGKQVSNVLNEATRPIQHATITAVWQFLNSGMSWDEAVKAATLASESPVKFRKEPR